MFPHRAQVGVAADPAKLAAHARRPVRLDALDDRLARVGRAGDDLDAARAHRRRLVLHEHGLPVPVPPGPDPIATGKAEALVQHLMPRRRWVDAG